MKSVLVIDTPLCCEDCPCSTIVKAPQINDCWSAHCEVSGIFNGRIMTKPECCPLKPMPHKLQADWYSDGYKEGFNACIEEIEK